MIINNFTPFNGQHCETTATGSLLKYIGIELSEPMLFGIGQGLGFIYWDMKNMDFPFIGGRIKPDLITHHLVNNLGLKAEYKETSSTKKAWENVKQKIDNKIPVGLKLDSYFLDYFTNKFHFAAHYVAMYGYDEKFAYLVDTVKQGGNVKTSLENLALARREKGLMSSKHLSYTISRNKEILKLRDVIQHAIKSNAQDYLNPPIKNIGYKGIEKASKEMKKWSARGKNVREDLKRTALLMEKAGTGGAIFRNLYRDFLKQSLLILDHRNIEKAYNMFYEIAQLWTQVSQLINETGETLNIELLNHAAEIVFSLSIKEKEAMELLREI